MLFVPLDFADWIIYLLKNLQVQDFQRGFDWIKDLVSNHW